MKKMFFLPLEKLKTKNRSITSKVSKTSFLYLENYDISSSCPIHLYLLDYLVNHLTIIFLTGYDTYSGRSSFIRSFICH